MAANTFTEKIKIQLHGANKAAKGASKVSKGMANLAKTALAAGAAFFGARALIAGLKESAELYKIQEQAVKKLDTAMGKNSRELQSYASQLQKVTKFGDEATLQQMAFLGSIGMSEQQIKDIIPVAMDLATATGMTLESAVRNTAKTFSGLAGELGELVPQIRDLTAEEMKAGKAVEVMGDLFGGQAQEDAKSYTGQIEQLKNATGDVKEQIGEGLMPSMVAFENIVLSSTKGLLKFLEAINFIDTASEKLNKQFAIQRVEIKMLFGELKNLNTSEERRKQIYKELNQIYPDLNLNLSEEVASKAKLVDAQEDLLKALEKEQAFRMQEQALEHLRTKIADAGVAINEFRFDYMLGYDALKDENANNAAVKQFERLKSAAEGTGRTVTGLADLTHQEFLSVAAIMDTMIEDTLDPTGLKKAQKTLISKLVPKEWKDAVNAFVDPLATINNVFIDMSKWSSRNIQDEILLLAKAELKLTAVTKALTNAQDNFTTSTKAAGQANLTFLQQIKVMVEAERAKSEATKRRLKVQEYLNDVIDVGNDLQLAKIFQDYDEHESMETLNADLEAYALIVAGNIEIEEQEFRIKEKKLELEKKEIKNIEALTFHQYAYARATKSLKTGLTELNESQVSGAMALGAAQQDAAKAAGAAASVFIMSELQKAIAMYITDSFQKFGIFGGILGAAAGGVVGQVFKRGIEGANATFAAEGFDGVVTEPTLFVAGEAGAEYVDIEPMNNEGAGKGGSTIIFQGNVMSQDFIESEAIPMIKKALRRGADLGIS